MAVGFAKWTTLTWVEGTVKMGLPSLLSPQGISSRNCMEASETGGGIEPICHLQALLGNGVKGGRGGFQGTKLSKH